MCELYRKVLKYLNGDFGCRSTAAPLSPFDGPTFGLPDPEGPYMGHTCCAGQILRCPKKSTVRAEGPFMVRRRKKSTLRNAEKDKETNIIICRRKYKDLRIRRNTL